MHIRHTPLTTYTHILHSHSSFLRLLRLYVPDCSLPQLPRRRKKEKKKKKKKRFGGRWRMNFFFSSRIRSFPTWWLMTHTYVAEKKHTRRIWWWNLRQVFYICVLLSCLFYDSYLKQNTFLTELRNRHNSSEIMTQFDSLTHFISKMNKCISRMTV